jgi:RNA recognition motif-containing protein
LYNGKFYSWDSINNKWLDPTVPVYAYTDYLTGLKFKWSQEANQWQQLKTTNPAAVTPASSAPNQTADKEKGWFDITEDRNTNVYVSGLPLDTTDEEFENLMTKYGIIAKDLDTGKFKVKLYRDENNEPKGDGRCTYLMVNILRLFYS